MLYIIKYTFIIQSITFYLVIFFSLLSLTFPLINFQTKPNPETLGDFKKVKKKEIELENEEDSQNNKGADDYQLHLTLQF